MNNPIPTEPVPIPVEPPLSTSGQLLDKLDKELDSEQEDKEIKDKFKNPFIRYVVMALLGMLTFLIGTYCTAVMLQIPIPESSVLHKFIDAIVSIMQMFV